MDNSKRARSEKSRILPRDRAYVASIDLQRALERIRQPAQRDKVIALISGSDCASLPEVGAQCGSSARWDLCGGRPVRAVPTATCAGANR
jgi:hypothetical protein